MQKALAAVRELLADHRLLEAEEAAALAERRAEIKKWEAAEAELLSAGTDVPDLSYLDDPPERNGPAKPRVPATAPPLPVSGTPDTTAKIARALARGPLMLSALVEAVDMSQPPISSRLAKHSGEGCPERERWFKRTSEGWGLTERGRKEFGV